MGSHQPQAAEDRPVGADPGLLQSSRSCSHLWFTVPARAEARGGEPSVVTGAGLPRLPASSPAVAGVPASPLGALSRSPAGHVRGSQRWSLDRQHQHPLETSEKCKLSSPILDLLNQKRGRGRQGGRDGRTTGTSRLSEEALQVIPVHAHVRETLVG